MKLLFLNPPSKNYISRDSRWPEETKSGTLYYPFWLAYATGYAKSKGHTVNLIDSVAAKLDSETVKNKIVEFDPEMIIVETTTPTLIEDIKFIDFVKASIKSRIVLVGAHPSTLPEETMNFSKNIDFIAIREYDETIVDLAENLEHPQNVKGICFRNKDKVQITSERTPIEELDNLPFVSKIFKEFLNFNDYGYSLARKPMIQILSSRGCPNQCAFCNLPQNFSGKLFRARSPINFVDELEYIHKELPEIKEIFIEDDTFTIDKSRVLRICNLIKEKHLNITWSVNARADLSYELMKEMKSAGCRLLVVGYESGSQKILNDIKKGITLQMSENFARNAKKAGLKVFGCFMIGLPGETRETIQETFSFAKKLSPDMVFFQQAVPFPGTEFYNWCKKEGYLLTEDYSKWLDSNGQLSFLISYPLLSAADLREIRDKLMINYYTSPKIILKTIASNLSPNEFIRVMRSGFKYLNFLFKKKER